MNENERLEYTIDEFNTLIDEIGMRINVIKQNNNIDIETKIQMELDLERKREIIKNGLLKPYFARIDFKSDQNKDVCYIGKNGVINSDDKIIVVDWRAPISSLYYDSNIGSASYIAPSGKINGELLLKRQYEIENGKLISYNDVDTVSNDEILKPYLNVNSDSRLKNIVSSIQSEQNKIIREKIHKNIVVQGVAGSGKTTVALHRVAYLAYNYKDIIKANQYMIIGPNKFFINYISSVLPELDVNDVKQLDFEELTKEILKENFTVVDNEDNESTYYKTSLQFKNVIDKYISDLDKLVVPNYDLTMYGYKILDREFIKKIYDSIESDFLSAKVEKCIILLKKEINKIKESLIISSNKYIDRLFEDEKDEQNKKLLIKQRQEIKKELESSCDSILKKHFNIVNDKIIDIYCNLLENIDKYVTDDKIINYLKDDYSNIKKKKIEYEDLTALLYLKYKINGNKDYSKYRQIVIDEAQDYNEFVFYTFYKLFKNANFSIFGDLAQSIYPYRSIEDWNIIKDKVMDFELLNLTKSYRTSIEIMNEANKINKYLNLSIAEPVIRHGQVPRYIKQENNNLILNTIEEFINKGFKTIAVISKNESDSKRIYNYLKDRIDLVNIDNSTSEYKGGICTVTSSLCKGLEFDAVIINNADSKIFDKNNKTDMRLLYVSMTRALHELVITYEKELVDVLK